ncbi:hypothetical protein E4U13_005838 [Claviceps humidiphila]|uniref:Uncharacterized protein n=1 Tax=Claviceps humidiphila TaxID=1294629 RepID=A0A9P7TXD4_9HYPO|nr:hypothetical protein E4U13_005838 [Claviceps humidiphila]
MDPSTTLITFTFETEPSVKSVQLIGSWDNFSTWYPMKQDTRRGRGQWRGCPAFKSISGGNASRSVQSNRNLGGLKMGRTYYYYYEIDGSTETHDPARPSTTSCPYLPGQTVNTIYIPVERTLRSRSASVNSLRQESFMTTDPEARFVPPVPPSTLFPHVHRHLGSVSSLLHARSSDRSESVEPPWNRLFGSLVGGAPISERPKTPVRNRDENSSRHIDGALLSDSRLSSSLGEHSSLDVYPESLQRFLLDDAPPLESVAFEGASSLEEQVSRDIYPESLQRVMVDDAPPMDPHAASDLFSLGEQHLRDVYPESLQRFLLDNASPLETVINGASTPHPSSSQPDQDDYFATPASLDTPAFTASTPPSQLTVSKGALSHQGANSISLTLITKPPSTHPFAGPDLHTTTELAQCTWSPAVSSSTCPASISPQSPLDEAMCSDNSDDDDDMASTLGGDCLSYRSQSDMPTTSEAFQRYSLPRHCAEDKVLPSANHHQHHHHQMGKLGSGPMLTVTARESSLPVAVTNFLGEPIDTGLDEFVSELGLMAEGIGRRES